MLPEIALNVGASAISDKIFGKGIISNDGTYSYDGSEFVKIDYNNFDEDKAAKIVEEINARNAANGYNEITSVNPINTDVFKPLEDSADFAAKSIDDGYGVGDVLFNIGTSTAAGAGFGAIGGGVGAIPGAIAGFVGGVGSSIFEGATAGDETAEKLGMSEDRNK